MKKILLLTVVGLIAMFATAYACDDCNDYDVCEGPGCFDGYTSEVGVYANVIGNTYAYADDALALSDGLVSTSVESDGVTFDGFTAWSSVSDGAGSIGAGGTGNLNFFMKKTEVWGPDKVSVPGGDCGDACLDRYFESASIDTAGGTHSTAYGDDVAAYSTGQIIGDLDMAGTTVQFNNIWSGESIGTEFKEAAGGADFKAYAEKYETWGSFQVPTN